MLLRGVAAPLRPAARRGCRLLFAVLLLTLLPLRSSGQPICHVETYSVNDGLSQRVITDMLQDENDFIWFATWNGICRFDGYTFKYFKSRLGDESNLDSNRIESIYAGAPGNIWCISYNNRVYLFDTATERFLDILAPVEEREGIACRVQRLRMLPGGVVWVLCDGGAFRIEEEHLDPETGEGILFCHHGAGSLPGSVIRDISVSDNGTEWLFTDGGFGAFSGGRMHPVDTTDYLSHCFSGTELYLITAAGELACCDTRTGSLRQIALPVSGRCATRIQRLNDTWLGICIEKGMILYEPATGRTVCPDFGELKLPPPRQPIYVIL